MRTDVKLGVVFALVLVLGTGVYFMFRGDGQAPIPLADSATNTPNAAQKPPLSKPKPGTPAASHLTQGNGPAKEGAAPAKPTPNAPIRQPRSTVALGPNGQPATSPPAAGPTPTSPPNRPVVQPSTPPAAPETATSPTPGGATPTPAANSPGAKERTAAPTSGTDVSSHTMNEPTKTGTPGADSARGSGLAPLTSSPSGTGSAPPTPPAANNTPLVARPETSASKSAPPTVTPPVSSPPVSERKTGAAVDSTSAAVDTHRVQPGDTLSSLAQTYYGDSKYAKVLADVNPELGNPNSLRLGAVIKVPALPADANARIAGPPRTDKPSTDAPARAPDGKRYYTVKSGDSFYNIAKAQLGNAARWKELLSLNSALVHGDPTSLQPGQKLVLPES